MQDCLIAFTVSFDTACLLVVLFFHTTCLFELLEPSLYVLMWQIFVVLFSKL
jgi:hypothetical protein